MVISLKKKHCSRSLRQDNVQKPTLFEIDSEDDEQFKDSIESFKFERFAGGRRRSPLGDKTLYTPTRTSLLGNKSLKAGKVIQVYTEPLNKNTKV